MASSRKKNSQKIYNLVLTAILAAIIVILQVYGSAFKVGSVSLSFVLIPICLGSIIIDEYHGLALGGIFGAVTLIMGITGADTFTNILLQNNVLATVLIAMGKALVAGYLPGLLFRLISNKNNVVAAFVAAASAPIANTGLFILLSLLVKDTITKNFIAEGVSFFYFMIIGCAGINFIVEFLTCVILTPSIYMAYSKMHK